MAANLTGPRVRKTSPRWTTAVAKGDLFERRSRWDVKGEILELKEHHQQRNGWTSSTRSPASVTRVAAREVGTEGASSAARRRCSGVAGDLGRTSPTT